MVTPKNPQKKQLDRSTNPTNKANSRNRKRAQALVVSDHIGRDWGESNISFKETHKQRRITILVVVAAAILILFAFDAVTDKDSARFDSVMDVVQAIVFGAFGWGLGRAEKEPNEGQPKGSRNGGPDS